MATAATPTHHLTADEFLAHAASRGRSELVGGEIRLTSPAGGPHGSAIDNLYGLLWTHVRAHRLGKCLPDGTGFDLTDFVPPRPGSTVRSPDLAFVRAEQVPPEGFPPGFLRLVPDLVVEVLSPSETASQLAGKLADYGAAGAPLIWVIDPATRQVTVVAAGAPPHWLGQSDTLQGDPVVPGFTCAVAELFEGVARG